MLEKTSLALGIFLSIALGAFGVFLFAVCIYFNSDWIWDLTKARLVGGEVVYPPLSTRTTLALGLLVGGLLAWFGFDNVLRIWKEGKG